eukprot:CAMPEP_0183563064 /NCGR_PEP_ID=MMETSP0371-20130417/100130_1 /TAXON_ID=268820 /ORGANISM="Peridinium aciculiferum, Strain PAER-2" /LENGTH=31 /DNA_ID= /DNA_START= /DNA_END= /DNA_ORIENTATION=
MPKNVLPLPMSTIFNAARRIAAILTAAEAAP